MSISKQTMNESLRNETLVNETCTGVESHHILSGGSVMTLNSQSKPTCVSDSPTFVYKEMLSYDFNKHVVEKEKRRTRNENRGYETF